MSAELGYLLGMGDCYPNSWNRHYLVFLPANDHADARICVADGFFPHDCGGDFTPSRFLNTPFCVRRLHELDLAWFIPYLNRMAAGERFTADEMQRVYFDHMGRYMEVSADGQFRFMERPKDLK
jgi:hypothetical protein